MGDTGLEPDCVTAILLNTLRNLSDDGDAKSGAVEGLRSILTLARLLGRDGLKVLLDLVDGVEG